MVTEVVRVLMLFPQTAESHWLSPADRDHSTMELKATGWVEVDDRDAIYKELHFKTFNQVCV